MAPALETAQVADETHELGELDVTAHCVLTQDVHDLQADFALSIAQAVSCAHLLKGAAETRVARGYSRAGGESRNGVRGCAELSWLGILAAVDAQLILRRQDDASHASLPVLLCFFFHDSLRPLPLWLLPCGFTLSLLQQKLRLSVRVG